MLTGLTLVLTFLGCIWDCATLTTVLKPLEAIGTKSGLVVLHPGRQQHQGWIALAPLQGWEDEVCTAGGGSAMAYELPMPALMADNVKRKEMMIGQASSSSLLGLRQSCSSKTHI